MTEVQAIFLLSVYPWLYSCENNKTGGSMFVKITITSSSEGTKPVLVMMRSRGIQDLMIVILMVHNSIFLSKGRIMLSLFSFFLPLPMGQKV